MLMGGRFLQFKQYTVLTYVELIKTFIIVYTNISIISPHFQSLISEWREKEGLNNDRTENSDTPYGNVVMGSGRSGDVIGNKNKSELNIGREGPMYGAQKEEAGGRRVEVGDRVFRGDVAVLDRKVETATSTRRDMTEMVGRWDVIEEEAQAALYYLGSSDPAASVSNRYNI